MRIEAKDEAGKYEKANQKLTEIMENFQSNGRPGRNN